MTGDIYTSGIECFRKDTSFSMYPGAFRSVYAEGRRAVEGRRAAVQAALIYHRNEPIYPHTVEAEKCYCRSKSYLATAEHCQTENLLIAKSIDSTYAPVYLLFNPESSGTFCFRTKSFIIEPTPALHSTLCHASTDCVITRIASQIHPNGRQKDRLGLQAQA